jgi:antitoxin component YwqK of YwqJK toxin-antitoxin module
MCNDHGKSSQLMKKLLLSVFTIISFVAYGQGTEERVLYVVDSIAVVNDPGEEEGTLTESDIETLTVVTNKADIEKHGSKDFDKIIFIITKEYAKRPVELRNIATVKQMERKTGKWYLKGFSTPYSGQFVDYYLNGKKQGDGILKAGVLEGLRTVYNPDGTTSYFRYYVNGVETGESKEYFQNGKLHQEGAYKNGKEDGLWKEWYSTGQLKRQTEFKEGKVLSTKEDEKFHSLFSKGIQLFNEENYVGAIKNYDKAIELNPNYSDVYFHRSRAYLHDLKFDQALVDCDKAIELEPMYREAYSNRAFVRLRKHELKNSRTLSKSSGVTILATKDKVEIPKDELEKICSDLGKGIQLGDNKPMILDAQKTYCQ